MVCITWLCDSGSYHIFICLCNLGTTCEDKNITLSENKKATTYTYNLRTTIKKRIIHWCMYIQNISSSVQLDISQVSTANEWDIKLNKSRDIPYVQVHTEYTLYRDIGFSISTNNHVLFCLLFNALDDFPKISEDFQTFVWRPHKCLQTLLKNFWRLPKISEDFQRLSKTFKESLRMFRSYMTKFKYSSRVKHDISEVVDIFISEDLDSTVCTSWVPDVVFYEFNEWSIFQ